MRNNRILIRYNIHQTLYKTNEIITICRPLIFEIFPQLKNALHKSQTKFSNQYFKKRLIEVISQFILARFTSYSNLKLCSELMITLSRIKITNKFNQAIQVFYTHFNAWKKN